MRLDLACVSMMLETYGKDLIPRFCKPEPRFHELRSFNELRYFTGHTLNKFGKHYFLDSGAFSAFASGVPITVDEYSRFLEKYADQVDIYANLDAIPDAATAEAKKIAAAKTIQNQMLLEKRGFKPIPVFHAEEPWEYLEHYLKHYDYICLGGLVSEWGIDNFLAEVWGNYLTNPDGSAKVKVHGFGMTTLRHMVSYKWHSVDSQTWLIHCKYGLISYPPRFPDGTWDYRTRPTLVGIGEKSGMLKEEGKHFLNMTPEQQEGIRQFVAQYGFKVEDLMGHPLPRFLLNIEYWLNVERAITEGHLSGSKGAQKSFQMQLL